MAQITFTSFDDPKVAALKEECDHFLSAYNPESLPRIAWRGMKPVMEKLVAVMSEKKVQALKIHSFPVASSPEIPPASLQHIMVDLEGELVTMLTSMPVRASNGVMFMWSLPPRRRSLENIIELGFNPIQVVGFIKSAVDEFTTAEMINMPPASA